MSTSTITDAIVALAETLAVVRDTPLISVTFDSVQVSDLVRVHLDSDNYAQVRAWNPEGVETTSLFTADDGEVSTFHYLKVGRIEVLAIFDEAPDRADLGDERDYS